MEIVCPACKEICYPTIVNNGIGAYEYGSQHGYDEELDVVSSCCHEPLDMTINQAKAALAELY